MGEGRVLGAGDAVLLSVAVFDGNDGTNVTSSERPDGCSD